jgi:tetratricopeptide (TPR) repeat protein
VVLFVAAFALLLASFPARNSNLWGHLAVGRDLAQGRFPDPRVHPPWLYDLLSYGLYARLGGPGLGFLKSLLVVGLGLLLLRLSWTRSGWWLPAVCTALALLAMSTRLLLQPATVSYLLLALTLWFLRDQEETAAQRPPPVLPPWPLLVLFVVWVNLDRWFLLGLGTVALVWLGQSLDGRGFLLRRALSFALVAGVCLLNPSHVHAFALPPELGWFDPPGALPLTGARVTSPFAAAYFAHVAVSPAGLAYFPLLGLGLLSFLVDLPRWHWQRFLPWLALASLSALSVRAIPFFAVLAGPVLAWNLQELFSRHSESERQLSPLWRWGVRAGYGLTAVLGLAFLVCAWPGWLQAPPFEPRRWAIETAPSLERGAAATRRWHQEGKLGPEDRGLHLSPATASAFAWFCPEEKGLLDAPLAAALLGTRGAPENWAERMRSAGINHVIVYDPDRGRLFAALDRLLADPEQWPLLYLEGDLAVFGWRDPARAPSAESFRGWELDLNRLAFHPSADSRAPRDRPEQEPGSRRWWDSFWKPAPPRPIDRDEAILYLLHAEALRRAAPARHRAGWEASQSTALVGAAGSWAGPAGLLDAHVRLVLFRPPLPRPGATFDTLPALERRALQCRQRRILQWDDTSPALLYLAVRAARRALAVNPNDAQTHLVLGQSYLRLLSATRERVWSPLLPELAQLRYAQASAALEQALSLKPDLAQAHLHLAALYGSMGYLDLALKHQRAYRKGSLAAGHPPEVGAEQFREEKERAEQGLDRLARVVQERENAYADRSGGLRVLDRAKLAFAAGLKGKARDVLLESDVSAFGPEGMALQLELLLRTGWAKEVREWTAPEQKARLGPAYHWLRAQALAAAGDYALAEEECAELGRSLAGDEPGGLRGGVALLTGQAMLAGQPGGESVGHLLGRGVIWAEFHARVTGLALSLRRQADMTVLRGLLALEEGEVDEARRCFRLALALWKDEATAASGAGLDFNGRVVAQGCLEWLR